MPLRLAASLAVLLALPAALKAAPLYPPRVSTEPITFIWPPEGQPVPAEAEFILGNVADAKAHFEINGQTVTAHKEGGFLAWLSVSPGTFTFHASLALSSGTVNADRRIFVPPAPAPLPDGKLDIDAASLLPKADLELRAGDWLTFRMKASRRKNARARIGKGPWHALREINPALGLYEAVLQVSPGEEFGPDAVEYEIGGGWSSRRLKAAALVSANAKTPAIATVKPNASGFANVKTSPSNGFLLFPQPGTRFLVTGREGGFARVALSDTLSGWIDSKDVELSTGTAPPRALTGSIAVTEGPSGAALRISLSERVPFLVEANENLEGATLRIFSCAGHTNWMAYEGDGDFIDEVRWRQEATDTVAVTVRLKSGRKLWGWNAHYEGGASLRLDLRRAPRIDAAKPLAGLKIMLDPGHMPSAPGAIGPLGTKEMDVNYAVAQSLADILKREGAVPLLTRSTTTDEVSLADRPRQAVERGADLFLSLHNNALPDGSNPFAKPRGFTIFYYHPQSLALARALHAAYRTSVPLADEGLQWGNLLVARLSAVPAILTESAYMILPEQEVLLNDPAFRETLAKTTAAGLKAFVLEAGERRPKK